MNRRRFLASSAATAAVISNRSIFAGAQEPEVIERMLDIATVDAARF